MVFQQYNLFPHRTALQNVMMAPVRVLKQDKSIAEETARALIKKVRLEGKEDAYPGSYPVVSNNAWQSHARSRCSPMLSCLMR